jgi:hypothetical protein
MSSYGNPPSMTCGGNILPSTFVKRSTTADKTLLQAAANDPIFGISQVGTHDAPGLSGSSAYAGISGIPIQYFIIGDACLLAANPSGAGWAKGDFLKSDASGYGTTGAAGSDNIGALALETTPGGQVGLVQMIPNVDVPVGGNYIDLTSTSLALTGAQAGTIVGADNTGTTTVTVTLPAVATVSPGDKFTVITKAKSTGGAAGTTLAIAAADVGAVTIYGPGAASAANKVVNTLGTANIGDMVTVMYDGTNWMVLTIVGTWARS